MPNILIPVTSPRACSGERGTYFAFTYYSFQRNIEFKQLLLGGYSPEFEDSRGIDEIVRKRLAEEVTGLKSSPPVPPGGVAAMGIVRACGRVRHLHGESNVVRDIPSIIGERVGAYAVIKAGARVLPVSAQLGPITSRGFQHAELGNDTASHVETDRLIHLPFMKSELRTHPVRAAIQLGSIGVAKGHEPFMAIHAGPDGSHQIEQFLHESS
jgi:hypothetical protein